jgi:hypothetical protein
MATRVPTVVTQDDKTVICTWTGLLNGDDGAPVNLARYPDKTVQVTNTFSVGGNVVIEGSNLATPEYGDLHDPQGGVLSTITTKENLVIAESPLRLRPRVSAGDGSTDLVVTIVAVLRGP